MRSISKLILLFFVAEVLIFLISAGIPVNSPSLVQQYNGLESSIRNQTYISIALSIFSNNVKVAILDFIPVIGIFMLAFSIVNTGMILSAVMTANHIPGLVAAIALLTLPHSFIELPSYAIATASGTYILLKRSDWRRGLLTFILVPIELFLAALVEASLFFVPNPYLMWAASAPILVGLYFFYQYLQKIADKYSIKTPQPQAVPQFSFQPFTADMQFYNQYNENWAKGLYYDSQGDTANAMNYMWSALINLLSAIAIRLGYPYYTKEDLDRLASLLSYQNPMIPYLYQQSLTAKNEGNYMLFKSSISQLISILQGIYQTSTFRRTG